MKEVSNKILLYSTGNNSQCLVINHNGKENTKSLEIVIRSRACGKELEYSWHILLESVCVRVCVCVWLGGSVCEGKGWPEAANSTEGLLAVSLLDFWTCLS